MVESYFDRISLAPEVQSNPAPFTRKSSACTTTKPQFRITYVSKHQEGLDNKNYNKNKQQGGFINHKYRSKYKITQHLLTLISQILVSGVAKMTFLKLE